MGRLTADPEIKQTPNGVAVAKFTLAVNRRFAKEGQQQADFINCVAWRSQADFISKYFRKGNMAAIAGSTTEVIADEVYFTGEKTNGGQSQNQGFIEIDDSDLPY